MNPNENPGIRYLKTIKIHKDEDFGINKSINKGGTPNVTIIKMRTKMYLM